jgi:hypothetical protein
MPTDRQRQQWRANKRRQRDRKRRGEDVYQIVLHWRTIEALVDAGFLTNAEADSPSHIEVELASLIQKVSSIRKKNVIGDGTTDSAALFHRQIGGKADDNSQGR